MITLAMLRQSVVPRITHARHCRFAAQGGQCVFSGMVMGMGALLLACISTAAAAPRIVPQPTSLVMGSGDTTITSSSKIYYADVALTNLAAIFQEEVMLVHGLNLTVQSGTTAGAGDILLKFNPAFPDTEKYQVTVNGSVTVEARSSEGIYPGTVTVIQSIVDVAGTKKIPNMTVVDEPFRQFRCLMADIKNQWHSVADLKQMIRMCRFYKVKYFSLHTGEEQWIGALLKQTDGFPAQTRLKHRLYTKAEMDDIIAFAREHGVFMLPHNESARGFSGMHEAVSKDFNPSDSYANFIDEYDGQGAYTGDFNDTRYWNFINEMTRRGIDQFAAGYPSGVLPYYHIGPVQGEGGMSRADAATIVGYVQAKSANTKTMFWNGINGAVNDSLSALKSKIVIAYYQIWGGSDINGYLNNGWEVVNAAWSPLYIVGAGLARTQQQVHDDWNTYRTGHDGFTGGGFDYDKINWTDFYNPATTNLVTGGMLATWEVPLSVHMDKLRLRLPAFVEHAWNHRTWPYAAGDYADFSNRFGQTDAYLTRFLMTAAPPSAPAKLSASDNAFSNQVSVVWSESDNNPTGYQIYRNTVNNFATASQMATVTTAEYADANVVSGVTYYYWVRAANAFGISAESPSDSGVAGTSNQPAVVYESFDYPAGSAIGGLNSGTGWATAWNQTSSNGICEINNYGLSYGALPVSGQSVRLNAATDTPSILLKRTTSRNLGIPGISTWTSFLLRCNKPGNGHCFLGFSSIELGKRWGAGIGIANNGSGQSVQKGNTYFIVCQSVNFNGTDEIYVWVNPALDRQPLKKDADLKLTGVDMTPGKNLQVNNQGYGQGSYDIDEIRAGFSWMDVNGGIVSTDAPNPNPMTWIAPPVVQQSNEVIMTCITAEDPDGVEYYFEETTGNPGANNSGWQASPIYTDSGLQPGYTYTYRVKARDLTPLHNETKWSIPVSVSLPRASTPKALPN